MKYSVYGEKDNIQRDELRLNCKVLRQVCHSKSSLRKTINPNGVRRFS